MIPYINMRNLNMPNVGIRGVRDLNVRMANIRGLNIPLPTLQIQEQIVSRLLEIKKLQKKYLYQQKLLNEQLASLSSDLLKGNT